MKINLFKIKESKLAQWKEWCGLLHTEYRTEAIETLKEENVLYEAFGIFELKGEWFTLGFGEDNGEPLSANPNRKLNQQHILNKKECLEYIGPIELLYELSR